MRSGWERGISYRVRLTPSLLDAAGRGYLGSENIEWNVPHGPPDDAEPLVVFEQRFPMNYEGYLAAGDTVGWRFPGGQTNLFEGLWTDPVAGIAYARARWYDARNASWLSEDPIGDVDSPNLYSFVGWKPNMETDPLGLMGPGERFLSQEEIERQIANYRRAEKIRQLRNRIAELQSQIEWLKFDVAVREYLLDIPEQNRRDKLWYFFAEAGASFDENMYLSRHFLGPAGT
ncbi:MAG: hypothetical protein GY835_27580, partial [bacterium]|nr:hypothetical protein [bacterium]